jgi:hypothetical protein
MQLRPFTAASSLSRSRPDHTSHSTTDDVKNDFADLIPFSRVPSILPRSTRTGKRVHPGCVYRWAQKGQNGVKLKALKIAGAWHTKLAWIREYFEAVTAAEQAGGSEVLRHDREFTAAERLLDAAGI